MKSGIDTNSYLNICKKFVADNGRIKMDCEGFKNWLQMEVITNYDDIILMQDILLEQGKIILDEGVYKLKKEEKKE